MADPLNMDCLIDIFRHLSMKDKLVCRLVCKRWQTSIDKLFSGQQSLEIIASSQTTIDVKTSDPSKTAIVVDKTKLNFRVFNFMLLRFRNITTLTIRNLMQLSDIIMFTITKNCDNLCTLNFCSCNGLTFDDNNEHSLFNNLTGYGWHLLTQAYPNLSSLTLRQCRLTEPDLIKIITACNQLKYLDISDNQTVGKSVIHLGPRIETLICGDLSNDEPIESILMNITKGNGIKLKSLTIFGCLSSLEALKKFHKLTELYLHFHTDEESASYLSDIGYLDLKVLVLEQIRCYEQLSAIDERQFTEMLKYSKHLEKLVITGDYEWDLRLSDKSLEKLVKLCPNLQELSLTGNGLISDKGISGLSLLPLNRLSLSSFHSVTDSSVKTILNKTDVRTIELTDLSRITENLVIRAINLCEESPNRQLDLTLSTSQLNKKLIDKLTLPKNLSLKLDTQRSNKLTDEEPTTLQMMIVIAMSALILLMALLTTVVVVLVPLAMAIMMIHEYLFHSFVLEMPTLMHLKGSVNLDMAVLKQAYLKLLYSLI